MGKAEFASALRDLTDGMDGVLANHSLVSLDEGESCGTSRKACLRWEFYALATRSVTMQGATSSVDSREELLDAIGEATDTAYADIEPATHASYPGHPLYRVVVSVPLSSLG